MPRRKDKITKWWIFDTVQEFWEFPESMESTSVVEKDNFRGRLQKGIIEGRELHRATFADSGQERTYDVIIVELVINLDRTSNWRHLCRAPQRTGKFDQFMDEVEDTARKYEIQYVLVEHLYNEFLPRKLERRGYFRTESNIPGRPNYLKKMY